MTILSKTWLPSGLWLSQIMLVTLHLALWLGVESPWSRPLLFAHLGSFLLWQPLWRGEERLSTRSAVIIVCVSVVALWWLNWWILAFWVSGLFSLVGGRVFAFHSKWLRFRYLLVMAYLLSVMLFWLTPKLFGLPTSVEESVDLMEGGLPLLLLLILLTPQQSEKLKQVQAVDFIYSVLLFMLLTLLVLGSLAFMNLGRVDYFQALLRTLFLMALLLFVLGWLWLPRLGFSGLQVIFSRSFLNIGTPFELWLNQLAQAQQEPSPAIFLKVATGHLVELSWLVGLSWESEEGKGMQGVSSTHSINVVDHDLCLTLFTRGSVAPSVLLHINLLSQMLAYVYQAKRREQKLREMARLQAVHETGSRLTHDLKNMLQSLLSLISIAEKQPAQAQPMLQQQLPILVQRIELTLMKLKTPKSEFDTSMVPVSNWWAGLNQRQQYRNITWQCVEKATQQLVPAAMFDHVADNLIENSRNKRLQEPDILISVQLQLEPVCLLVCDTGSQIPEIIVSQLLHTVVDSKDGFGVGLYQAAQWAEKTGYCLKLKENNNGRVCFELSEKV
jgi:signal transduction histidine kinase